MIMNKNLTVVTAITLLALFFTGCASQDSDVRANANFKAGEKFYVDKLPADERGVDSLIVQNLRDRGLQAMSGPAGQADAQANYVLSYEDRWAWDMTMYMYRLTIKIYNRQGSLLASGESMRPSIERKPPEVMVDETLDAIFAKVDPSLVTEEVEDPNKKAVRAGGRSGLSGDNSHEF